MNVKDQLTEENLTEVEINKMKKIIKNLKAFEEKIYTKIKIIKFRFYFIYRRLPEFSNENIKFLKKKLESWDEKNSILIYASTNLASKTYEILQQKNINIMVEDHRKIGWKKHIYQD